MGSHWFSNDVDMYESMYVPEDALPTIGNQ